MSRNRCRICDNVYFQTAKGVYRSSAFEYSKSNSSIINVCGESLMSSLWGVWCVQEKRTFSIAFGLWSSNVIPHLMYTERSDVTGVSLHLGAS